MGRRKGRLGAALRHHGLSLLTVAILAGWVGLYAAADDRTHLGALWGNAIADWTGTLLVVLGTKVLYEAGSRESRPVRGRGGGRARRFLRRHSLSLFLALSGGAWAALYAVVDPNAHWGQVVGNLLSEWVQILGLVLMSKRLLEKGSKESADARG